MMQTLLSDMPAGRAALLAAVPLLYLLAAAAAGSPASVDTRWRMARLSAAAAVGASTLTLVWLLASGAGLVRGPALLALGELGALHLSLRSDALGALMLLLVSFIGWLIVGYSQTYLGGERGQPRYIRGLMLTLAAVSLLVLSNNLLLLALSWIFTSLALHGLLTFFETRPQALVAAHKKFIASRVADLFLLAAIVLVSQQLGTLEIDEAIAAAKALPAMTGPLQAAALLLAASALMTCAQLPVHGWLIQVMEAPTPVSALLHAGVVNLGGFLLIRIGSLVGDVPAAQALLVVFGSVTAVVAALVMMTRISIKVSLAWSTCAQMGFMLMQCGLGLYDLALLHLVAHSLYKAYAFLGAGSAVEQNRLQQMTPPSPPLSASQWLLGALVGMVVVAAAALVWGFSPAKAPALWALGGILSLALAPLLAGPMLRAGGWWRLAGLAGAFAVALAYFGLHAVFSRWLSTESIGAAPSMALVAWVLCCFGLLFVVQGAVRARPQGALARSLYPWLFAGLYLDELFTRLTFRVWPARAPTTPGTLDKPTALTNFRTPGDL
ncbi:MAG: NADH-quinone oxidoreductase subunit L [Polaromonas sp.]|nr:NADH-quinone oxidoreductase subunit L [Polaromonas sp.]